MDSTPLVNERSTSSTECEVPLATANFLCDTDPNPVVSSWEGNHWSGYAVVRNRPVCKSSSPLADESLSSFPLVGEPAAFQSSPLSPEELRTLAHIEDTDFEKFLKSLDCDEPRGVSHEDPVETPVDILLLERDRNGVPFDPDHPYFDCGRSAEDTNNVLSADEENECFTDYILHCAWETFEEDDFAGDHEAAHLHELLEQTAADEANAPTETLVTPVPTTAAVFPSLRAPPSQPLDITNLCEMV